MRSYASRLSREEAELEHLEARAKHTQPVSAPGWSPRPLQFWSRFFLRARELARRAGDGRVRPRASSVAMTSPMKGVDRPTGPRRKKGASRNLYLQELPASCSGGLIGGHRRRLLRDVNEACRALNWMDGEETRPLALPPSLVAGEDKKQCLRAGVQQRVILAALRWVDADSAVDGHEALPSF